MFFFLKEFRTSDLSADEEKKLVEEVFNNAIDSLSDEDKSLPQVHFFFFCFTGPIILAMLLPNIAGI